MVNTKQQLERILHHDDAPVVAGEVVFLRQYAKPAMTVRRVNENGLALCEWFDRYRLRTHEFNAKSLTRVCPLSGGRPPGIIVIGELRDDPTAREQIMPPSTTHCALAVSGVAFLRSAGPPIIVRSIEGDEVRCEWFDDCKVRDWAFQKTSLTAERPDPPRGLGMVLLGEFKCDADLS